MKVLCGTDFSQSANDAAEVAASLAARLRHRLSLVYCLADWLVPPDYPVVHPLDDQARELLDDEVGRVCSKEQMVETKLLHGNVSHHLITESAQDTSMIVMGATGKGAFARSLIGSVAEHVAESASVPTWVVRNAQPLLNWLLNNKPLKVLCAIDAGESEAAIPQAVADLLLVGPLEVECAYFMHVGAYQLEATDWRTVHPALLVPDEAEIGVIQSRMKQAFNQTAGFGPIAVHVRQAIGNPAYDFITIADNVKADLVVVGSHHKHGLQRLLHPSFSRRVLAHSTTNVLCVSLLPAKDAGPHRTGSDSAAMVGRV
ncbi:nucleotide-binding universal stress UspA family protein [Roseimicrobium gellanilyticum]|uniref:Nucleotide-binding universal stress UspA family protein n=1 Tax=Roseimicrobium gellanilyticum TaxID=748857 RepID=A0A366HAK2_9BACT|nr:universal stress protein [Roseimicrobium gellanilyticum]RBP38177.1 nucleotide-binding universal stress UspA family protein [Roseimicrobium gellanilyticum]